jgi:hypothetical protein
VDRDRPAGGYCALVRQYAAFDRGGRSCGAPLSARSPRVAFLFLGETLLIPHLYPIVEALAEMAPDLAIDVWVSTSVHEGLIARWLGQERGKIRIRRAPGFRDHPELIHGENPPLPAKIPMLARSLPHLLGASVVVCAEQTSLWLPAALPFLRMRFVITAHGAGSINDRVDRRRDAAWLQLLPSRFEADEMARCGQDAARTIVTGYVKAAFRHQTPARQLFADDRPIVVYAPHWQKRRSSWWAWGREIVEMLAAQDRWNVILAPHQRLIEKNPAIRDVLGAVAHLPHVHVDLDSFAMVDGSYMAAADVYLGDTSSQVVEYLMTPRPCIFLDAQGIDWRATDDHDFWECGPVLTRLADLPAALDSAFAAQPGFDAIQRDFAAKALGDVGPDVARRAAAAVLGAIPA